MADPAADLQRALAFHQQGMLNDAEALYRSVLKRAPREVNALNLLGVIETQRGNLKEAERLLRKAASADPGAASVHSNLGIALSKAGRSDDALQAFDQALAIYPYDAVALSNRGNILLELGRAAEALQSYDRALSAQPNFVNALFNRGNALRRLSRHGDALATYNRALAADPNNADVLANRGNALADLGRLAEALASYDRALSLRPDLPSADGQRGNILLALGRTEEALAALEKALAVAPNDPTFLVSAGHALDLLGRDSEALVSYSRAINAAPADRDALINCGRMFMRFGRLDEAIAIFAHVVNLNPSDCEALTQWAGALTDAGDADAAKATFERALALTEDPDLKDAAEQRGPILLALERPDEALAVLVAAAARNPGDPLVLTRAAMALAKLRRDEEALAYYERALTVTPNYRAALVNCGLILLGLGRIADAVALYSRAAEIYPEDADVLARWGGALSDSGNSFAAQAAIQKALELAPSNAAALQNLANLFLLAAKPAEAAAVLQQLLKVRPKAQFALGRLLHAKSMICDWQAFYEEHAHLIQQLAAGEPAAHPFDALVLIDDETIQRKTTEKYLSLEVSHVSEPTWPRQRSRHDRIKIAYLSADFHEHATAYLAAGLFEAHDRSTFEVTGVSYGPDVRVPMRERLEKGFERFVSVPNRADAEIARLVADAETDIVVDLKGYTRGCRPGILARRPGPIQVAYLGYPGTAAAPFIDYILADANVVPPESFADYSEQVVHLPGCYQVNDNRRTIENPPPSRTSVGLPENGFVFASFNNHYKITPSFFDIWMRLLHHVEGSALWLMWGRDSAEDNLRREAEKRGVDGRRIVFAQQELLPRHLARHALADLCLDTLPVGAHTTASDALYAGVPLLTCLGRSFAGRVAASLLRTIGVPELIANSLDDYETLGLRLARDPGLLAGFAARIRDGRTTSALFDTERTTRSIETAYHTMWERHLAGLPPAGFSSHPLPSLRAGSENRSRFQLTERGPSPSHLA